MKNRLKDFVAIFFGLLLSVLICEVVLRIYNPFQFRQKEDKIVLPSNYEMRIENNTIENLDAVIQHTKNSLGFRGLEKPTDFEDWTSIIAVGGSTTECLYISDGKDWVSLLGNKLNEQFDEIWINNAGLEGHSTFGHQLLLQDHLVKLKPDYILFLIGCNDIERKDLNDFDSSKLKNNTWKSVLVNNSELMSLIINLVRVFRARKMNLVHDSVKFEELDVVDSIDYELVVETIEYQKQFTVSFEDRLKNLVHTSKKNNIIPILITQPTLVGKGIDAVTGMDLEKIKYCDELGGRLFWEKLEVYNDVTRKVAKDESVFLIDLAHELPKSTELFYDCVHFTNKGAGTVAQILNESIEKILAQKILENYGEN